MSESFGSRRWFAVSALLLGLTILGPQVRADESAKSVAGDPYAVPDGTPEELLAFIKQLQNSIQTKPLTRPQRRNKDKEVREGRMAIIAAAEKILESRADDAIVAAALAAEFEALAAVFAVEWLWSGHPGSIPHPGVEATHGKIESLLDKYKDDSRPAILLAVIQCRRFWATAKRSAGEDPKKSRAVTSEVILSTGDKLLKSNVDDAVIAAALMAEFDELNTLIYWRDHTAQAKLSALTEEYKNDTRPAVAESFKLRDLAEQELAYDIEFIEEREGFFVKMRLSPESSRASRRQNPDKVKQFVDVIEGMSGGGAINDPRPYIQIMGGKSVKGMSDAGALNDQTLETVARVERLALMVAKVAKFGGGGRTRGESRTRRKSAP